jgi:inner membrane protein
MAAAWIPDIDIFFTTDPEAYLRFHRGVTHSLWGGFVLALLLALLFWAFKRKQWRFGPLLLLGYGCVLTHIFLDWVNNYGTLIFAPWSNYRAMLGTVFIIDPFLTVGLLGLLVVAAIWKKRRRAVAWAAVAAMFAYPFSNHGVRLWVERLHTRDATSGEPVAIHAEPDFLTPLRWKVLAEHEHHYGVFAHHLLRGASAERETFVKADRDLLRRLGREDSLIEAFEWFVDYPVVQPTAEEGGTRLLFWDLRFYSLHPLWQQRTNHGQPPFSLEILLSPEGDLLEVLYHQPSFRQRAD